MRIDCREHKVNCGQYRAYDKDTGLEIPNCFMADDKTGEYGIFPTGPNGRPQVNATGDDVLREYRKGNIEIRKIS